MKVVLYRAIKCNISCQLSVKVSVSRCCSFVITVCIGVVAKMKCLLHTQHASIRVANIGLTVSCGSEFRTVVSY
jgi:hypothetical protein